MKANYEEKVNKSGDTLTGGLLFENTDEYDAIRKNRVVNGQNYQLSIGVGANASSRMELVGPDGQTLCNVEVRSDGIYNGFSNMKLGETVHLTWGNSLSFKLQGGHHALVMIGKNDCLMLWPAGNPTALNVTRILGTTAQATYNASTQIVTVTFGGGSFTGSALII